MKTLAIILAVTLLSLPANSRKLYIESDTEKQIYSYVQVPQEYYHNKKWRGDWTDIEAGGQKFFFFGCGVCCLSNMISTLNGVDIKPDEMFALSKEQTNYNPDSGVGALSWKQLKSICEQAGLNADVRKKPDDIDTFRKDVADSDTTMVLVCKYDDDALWFYTNGHYVNLWEYDPATDTVFITDSSGMFNRKRVQMEDVYNALKTRSEAQYMTVNKEA